MRGKKFKSVVYKIGVVKNPDLPLSKTYVYFGKQNNINGPRPMLYIRILLLMPYKSYGWKLLKRFKNMYLQETEVALRLSTFTGILEIFDGKREFILEYLKRENL